MTAHRIQVKQQQPAPVEEARKVYCPNPVCGVQTGTTFRAEPVAQLCSDCRRLEPLLERQQRLETLLLGIAEALRDYLRVRHYNCCDRLEAALREFER